MERIGRIESKGEQGKGEEVKSQREGGEQSKMRGRERNSRIEKGRAKEEEKK